MSDAWKLDNTEMVRRFNMTLNITDFHYIVLTHIHAWLIKTALPAAHGVMLDYGSGGQPYRGLFETKVTRYIAADMQPTGTLPLDVKLEPGKPVPLDDQAVDTILSSQTLEHTPDPGFYLRECFRLLRPGGVLLLTAPMQWRHHEVPYDFYRFTRYGLDHLLKAAGFNVDSITPAGGAFALLGQTLINTLFERIGPSPRIYGLINRATFWLDKHYPDGDDTINWMCLARKP